MQVIITNIAQLRYWTQVTYKFVASILLNRLRRANVGGSLSSTQFGFRSGTCVSHALFMVRRFIDNTFPKKDGKFVVLALDLSKAFDSIKRDKLIKLLLEKGMEPEARAHLTGQ